MASLDKLSNAAVKELEELATHFASWEGFEDEVRHWAGNVWNGENSPLSDATYQEFKTLGTQYDSVVDFQDQAARYAELAWGHARQNSDPGPQANAHLTGTPAQGDVMAGHPDNPPWASGVDHVEESGIVTTGPVDDARQQDAGSLTASTPPPAEFKSYE